MNKTTNTAVDDVRLQKIAKSHMGYSESGALYKKLGVNTVETSERSVVYTDVVGPKIMTKVSEAGLAPTSPITQGFVAPIVWEEYNLNHEITYDARKTDQQNSLSQQMKDYATAVVQTQDYVFGRLFRQAFNTGVLHADGKSLISAAHPLKSGGTTSNTFTDTQKALSYDSLYEGINVFQLRMKNHANERIPRQGTSNLVLMVPNDPVIVQQAFQLAGVKSPDLKPGTDQNDANFYKYYEGVNIDLIVSDVITLAIAQDMGETTTLYTASSILKTMWFLLDKKMIQAAFKKVVLNDSNSIFKESEKSNLVKCYNTFSFFGFGTTSIAPLAVFGSKGDGTATNF